MGNQHKTFDLIDRADFSSRKKKRKSQEISTLHAAD